MKTIEERAREYALQFEERYQVAMFKAYIDGATEQKQIDDQHILFLADAHEHEKKLLIDKACEYLAEFNKQVVFQVNIDDFRKEMKGE